MSDAQGRVTVLEVYRCDHPGCGKLFQTRGALHTHQVCLPRTNCCSRTPASRVAAAAGLAQAPSQGRADIPGTPGSEAPRSGHDRDPSQAGAARR